MSLAFGDLAGTERRSKLQIAKQELKRTEAIERRRIENEEAEDMLRQQELAMIDEQLKKLHREVPSAFLVPNVGQAKALKYMEQRPFPKDLCILGGNGFGKTVCLVKIFAGVIFGPRVMVGSDVHNDYEGELDYDAWRVFRDKAREQNRPIYAAIVAAADSLKGSGAMMQRFVRFFPKGCWKEKKLGKQYVAEMWCWDSPELKDEGDEGNAVAVIAFKTMDQPEEQMPGPDYDIVGFDEPPPAGIYEEMIGRCRANEDAIRIYSMTPLKMAGWFIDEVVNHANNPENRIVVVYGSLWDNCGNWHPDDGMWSGGKVGEGRPLNRGNPEMPKINVDAMINAWRRRSPMTVEARVWGKPTHTSGAIYECFSPAIHINEGKYRPPVGWEDWPIWNIIDPHHARPPAVGWFLQCPDNKFFGLGEYPFEEYDKLEMKSATSQDHAEMIQDLEYKAGISDRVIHRFGDPNTLRQVYSSRTETSNETLTIQDIYANCGLFYELANDNLTVGHECLNSLLYYDPNEEMTGDNEPQLLFTGNIFNNWREQLNMKNGLSRYKFKDKALNENLSPRNLTGIVDQKYKDFPDICRYFAVTVRDYDFQPVSARRSLVDMIALQRRNPKLASRMRSR
jgi:phage terminase large subunit-like protein